MARLDYIDIARGLAMLFVIFWHTINIHSPWSDGWVMPLFFVIMGMFYRQQDSLKKLLVKKTNTLIIPLLICSIPALFFSLCKNGILETFIIISNPYRNINGTSWFLICMFECYILYWVINRFWKKWKTRFIICIIVSIVGFYSSKMHVMGHRFVLPFYMSTSLTCLAFIDIGQILVKYLYMLNGGGGKILWKILVIALFIFEILFLCPKPLEMIWNNYKVGYIQFWIEGVLGSVVAIILCHDGMIVLQPLKFLGKWSLLILLLHGYVYSYLLIPFIGSGFLAFCLTVIFTTFLAYSIDKLFPYVSGRKPLIKLRD